MNENMVIRREPCPRCRAAGRDASGDNLAVYADESTWCFACNRGTIHKDVEIYESEELMEFGREEWTKLAAKCADGKESKNPNEGFLFRGITDDTYKTFGVYNMAKLGSTEIVEQYYPLLEEIDGQLQIVGTKVRKVPKDFYVKGRNRATSTQLFGQYLAAKSGKKTIVIAAGECFPGDVEVLTQRGFVRFDDVDATDLFGAVSPSGRTVFEPALAIIDKPYRGDYVTFSDPSYTIQCTAEHTLVFYDTDGAQIRQLANQPVPESYRSRHAIKLDNTTQYPIADSSLDIVCLFMFTDLSMKPGNDTDTVVVKGSKGPVEALGKVLERRGIPFTDMTFELPEDVLAFLDGVHFNLPYNFAVIASEAQRLKVINAIDRWSCNTLKKGIDSAELQAVFAFEGRILEVTDHTFYVRNTPYRPTTDLEMSKTVSGKSGVHNVYCVKVSTGAIVVRYKGRITVIGNCDVMATYQMLKDLGPDCPAIVSSTTGERSVQQFRAQYDLFNKFERIVVIPDQDKAGLEALDELVQALPKDKVYVVELPLKDPNDMLMKHLDQEFIKRYKAAKPYVPDGVVSSSELYSKVLEASL